MKTPTGLVALTAVMVICGSAVVSAGPDGKTPKALPDRVTDVEGRLDRLERAFRAFAPPTPDPEWVDELRPPAFVAGKDDAASLFLARWTEAYVAADRARADLVALRATSASQKGTVGAGGIEAQAAELEATLAREVANAREWKRRHEAARK